MRQIAAWASAHRWTSRLLIVLVYQFLNLAGYFNGFFLSAGGTDLPPWIFWATIGIAAAAILAFHLVSQHQDTNRRFISSRVVHIILGTCSCCLFLQLGNYESGTLQPVQPAAAAMAPKERLADKALQYVGKQKDKLRLRHRMTALRQWYQDLSNGAKAALVALTIIVGVAAIIALAALACSLACSGAEVIAVILLLAGIAGVIVGVVFICRRIMHGPRLRT